MKKSNKRISSKPTIATNNHQQFNNINANSLKIQVKPCNVVLKDILIERNEANINFEDLGDGVKVRIFKCKSKRCGLKEQFVARDKAISTCSKRIYDCVIQPGSTYIDCHTSNVIYMLTCSTCGLQYIGETSKTEC